MTPSADPDPYLLVTGLATSHVLSRAIWVAASLGVADALADAELDEVALAKATQADAALLARVLRLLVGKGVFVERAGKFANNDVSHTLREAHERSLRSFVRMNGAPSSWRAFEALGDTVRHGKIVDPKAIWDMRSADREIGALFDDAMRRKALREIEHIVDRFDFAAHKCVADIGGGTGHLIRAILSKCSTTTGVLFDLPEVVRGLPACERLAVQGGSFFENALPRADLYVLMNIIHDWPDREAKQILRAVRGAAPVGAKLMLIELVLPDGGGASGARVLDLVMMAVTGGMERTFTQYSALGRECGFGDMTQIELPTGFSVLTTVTA
jgi:hypothetical protein